MRIDRLKIQNFSGFESCEIEFNQHFNLLVGDNASGKSSVLDAISILLDSWICGIKGDEKGGGIDPDYIRLAAHTFKEVFRFEPQFPVRLEAAGTFSGEALNWARERTSVSGRTKYVEAKNVSSAAHEAASIVRAGGPITLPLICSYGTERLWLETEHRKDRQGVEKKKLPSRLDGYKDCNSFRIQETAFLDWIRAEVSASQQLAQETTAYGVIRRAILDCIEDATSFYYDERYTDAVVAFEHMDSQLYRNLSDGQRIMISLVGDIVRRAETLNPHLGNEVLEKTPGVVLIDELDLHLHPKWQRRVIHDLKRTFPAIQFITTTHSPQLIGEAQPSEIRILADGKAYTPPRSFGLDSSRVLGEIQGARQRNPEVESLITNISEAIEEKKFDEAKTLLADLEGKIGTDDVEVTRARSLMKFMESAL